MLNENNLSPDVLLLSQKTALRTLTFYEVVVVSNMTLSNLDCLADQHSFQDHLTAQTGAHLRTF